MSATKFNVVTCGNQADWWVDLLRGTRALIDGEASLALLPAQDSVSTQVGSMLMRQFAERPASQLVVFDEPALLVMTSGATGSAKVVMLSRASLLAASELASRRIGQARSPWICALPVDHIGGYMTVFRSLAGSSEPIRALAEDGRFDRNLFARALSQADESVCCSLVWRQLREVVLSGESSAQREDQTSNLARLHTLLLGGGLVDTTSRDVAFERGIKAITTYGMTETSGGVVWDSKPLDQVVVSTDAATESFGRITVSGPTVAIGYLSDNEQVDRFENSTFTTQDLGVLSKDGQLTVLGRADETVIVNGHNVSLGAVEHSIAQIPGVNDAAAFVDDSQGSNRLLVAIDCQAGSSLGLAEVRAHLAVALGRGAMPADVIECRSIPRTRSGKIDRVALVETLAGNAGSHA